MSDFIKMQEILLSGEIQQLNTVEDINASSEHSGLNILLYFISVSEQLKSVDFQKLIDLLLQRGLDINYSSQEDGGNCIHYCVYHNNIRICEHLLNVGAQINHKDFKGNTPLWRAVMNYRGNAQEKAIIVLLLSKGANINAQNNHGKTPLDLVMEEGESIDDSIDPKEWDLRDIFRHY